MPKNKKVESSSDDSDSGPDDRTPAKKSKSEAAPPAKTSDSKSKSSSSKSDDGGDGDGKTWILEKMRMVKISEFRGRQMVDIREHYEANGEIKPGKKGISLSLTQWKKLCSIMDEVNKQLD